MYISRMPITEEDKQAIIELQHQATEKAAAIEKAHNENASSEEYNRVFDEYNRISRKLFDLRESIRKRYVVELSQDKAKALQNAADILEAYTKKDYQAEAAQAHKWAEEKLYNYKVLFEQEPSYKDIPEIKKEYDYYKEVKATSYRNFKGAYTRLTFITKDEREALVLGGHGTEELDILIYNRAATFYKPNKYEARSDVKSIAPPLSLQSFADAELVPVYNGPMTSIFASLSTKGLIPVRDKLKLEKASGRSVFTYTLTPNKDTGVFIAKLNPSTKKLLFRIQDIFTALNTYAPDDTSMLTPEIKINLKDYAEACGIPVDDKAKLDNFRKKVKENVNILYEISIDGQEPAKAVKGQPADVRFRLFESIDTRGKGGCYSVALTMKFAAYLANSYLIQAPKGFYALPDNNPNCIAIGLKLCSHSSMRNNILQGTANIIGVKTLLEAASDIQSYEELKATNNRNWKRCIREPLEAALELNVDCKVIREWYYCGSKGAKISDAELDSKTYDDYEALYIHFTMYGNREKLLEDAKSKGGNNKAKHQTRSGNKQKKQ